MARNYRNSICTLDGVTASAVPARALVNPGTLVFLG
jgi:hypothetical protein